MNWSRPMLLVGFLCGALYIPSGAQPAAPEKEPKEPAERTCFVISLEKAKLYPRVTGYIKKWMVDIGDTVKKGDLLTEVDAPELRNEVQEKQARVGQARARLAKREASVRAAQANLVVAQSRAQEAQLVLKKNQKADRAALEQAEAAVKTAEATIKAAEAQCEECQAGVKEAAAELEVCRKTLARSEALLRYTRIESPIDGVVVARNVNTTDFVSPTEEAPDRLKFPLYEIWSYDRVGAEVELYEKEIFRVKVGHPVVVRVPGFKPIKAKISRLMWHFGAGDRKQVALIELPNVTNARGLRLLPGMFAKVTVEGN